MKTTRSQLANDNGSPLIEGNDVASTKILEAIAAHSFYSAI